MSGIISLFIEVWHLVFWRTRRRVRVMAKDLFLLFGHNWVRVEGEGEGRLQFNIDHRRRKQFVLLFKSNKFRQIEKEILVHWFHPHPHSDQNSFHQDKINISHNYKIHTLILNITPSFNQILLNKYSSFHPLIQFIFPNYSKQTENSFFNLTFSTLLPFNSWPSFENTFLLNQQFKTYRIHFFYFNQQTFLFKQITKFIDDSLQ